MEELLKKLNRNNDDIVFEEIINKETLSDIYRVDFEIMEIEGRPLSIYY